MSIGQKYKVHGFHDTTAKSQEVTLKKTPLVLPRRAPLTNFAFKFSLIRFITTTYMEENPPKSNEIIMRVSGVHYFKFCFSFLYNTIDSDSFSLSCLMFVRYYTGAVWDSED
jgi:hypothetical protein